MFLLVGIIVEIICYVVGKKREIFKNGNITPSGWVEGILDRKKAA